MKCSSMSFRKDLPILVLTFLLKGGLYHIIFLFFLSCCLLLGLSFLAVVVWVLAKGEFLVVSTRS